MLNLPPKFKQALGNGVRTSLYPLVRIYKGIQIDDEIPEEASINLSIKETNIGGEAYDPLLLNTPSISSKADIINNKYTISSVSISISNAPYKGKIFSDDIPSLLNSVTQIYYAANGLDTLEDCLLVYTGTIRRYSQSAETLSLTLEDLTEQKLTTKVPATLIEEDEFHKKEDIGKPYPMVYGTVDGTPLIFNNNNQLEIDKPNKEIIGHWDGAGQINFGNPAITDGHPLVDQGYLKRHSYLSVFENGYVPIYETATTAWGSRLYDNLYNDNQLINIYTLVPEPLSGDSPHIQLHGETFIHEQYDMENNDGFGEQGLPSRIYRPITKASFFAYTPDTGLDAGNTNDTRFIGYRDNEGEMHRIIETISLDGDNEASPAQELYYDDQSELKYWQPTDINENLSGEEEVFAYTDDRWENIVGYAQAGFPVSWIQNNDYEDDGNNRSGLHISAQNIAGEEGGGGFVRLQFDENVGSLPCVTKILYDIAYFTPTNIGWESIDSDGDGNNDSVHLTQAEPTAFWLDRNLAERTPTATHINGGDSDYNSTAQDFKDSEIYWERDRDLESFRTPCDVPNREHQFTSISEEFNLEDDAYIIKNHFSNKMLNDPNSGFHNIIQGFNTTNAYNSIQWGMPKLKDRYGDLTSSCIANLRELYILQDVLITDIPNKNFHADIAGRSISSEGSHIVYDIVDFLQGEEYSHSVLYTETAHGLAVGDVFKFYDSNDNYEGEFTCTETNLPTTLLASIGTGHGGSGRIEVETINLISSANGIMKDILEDELLYAGSIDESGVDVQNEGNSNPWAYSFAVSEQKEAKSIFEGLFKSSLLIPSFDSAGQFKFIGIKQIIDSYDGVAVIDSEDIIKYSFELTKLDDVYNSVNVKYKKNYGSGEFDVQTGYEIGDSEYTTYDQLTTEGLGYSGNNAYDIGYYGLSSEDSKLEVETEYIRDKYTAHRLQKRLLMWYCNQHLVTKIDLPAHYMHLEAGDYIKYNELMGGKLAFGYDYSQLEARNGQLVYDVFFITKVSKSLSKVSIEAVQVHRGQFGFPSINEEDEGDIVNGNDDDVTENWQLGDPSDDPNYNEDSINTDEFVVEEDPFLRIQMGENRTLNNSHVVGYVSTNMDESWEYNIWVRVISSSFEYDGIEYNAGEYEVGDLSGMDLVTHTLTMQGNNGYIRIDQLFEFYPEGAVIEFLLEIKNTEFQLLEPFDQLGIEEEEIEPLLGDVNGDGIINVLDVVRLLDIILDDNANPTDDELERADMNGDGIHNVQDVIFIINEILDN